MTKINYVIIVILKYALSVGYIYQLFDTFMAMNVLEHIRSIKKNMQEVRKISWDYRLNIAKTEDWFS